MDEQNCRKTYQNFLVSHFQTMNSDGGMLNGYGELDHFYQLIWLHLIRGFIFTFPSKNFIVYNLMEFTALLKGQLTEAIFIKSLKIMGKILYCTNNFCKIFNTINGLKQCSEQDFSTLTSLSMMIPK